MSDNMTHAQRLRLYKKIARQQKRMVEQSEMTADAYEVEKAYEPKKLNGKWFVEVKWKNSFQPPAAVQGCAELMAEKCPCYKGKTADQVRADLYAKQCENDGVVNDLNDEEPLEENTIQEIQESLMKYRTEIKGSLGTSMAFSNDE